MPQHHFTPTHINDTSISSWLHGVSKGQANSFGSFVSITYWKAIRGYTEGQKSSCATSEKGSLSDIQGQRYLILTLHLFLRTTLTKCVHSKDTHNLQLNTCVIQLNNNNKKKTTLMCTNVCLGHKRCCHLMNFKRVSQCLRKQHLNMWRQSPSAPVSSLKSNSHSAHSLHYRGGVQWDGASSPAAL